MQMEPPEDNSDRPARVPWPPLLYAATACVASLLERYAPGLPAWPQITALLWLGGGLVVLGVGIGLAGIARFVGDGTTLNPTGHAKVLATQGIYAYTRNPMYLGAVVAFAGLALALRSPWLMLLVPLLGYGLVRLAIRPEEAYLERRFGASYRDYKARVRRWI